VNDYNFRNLVIVQLRTRRIVIAVVGAHGMRPMRADAVRPY